MARHLDFEQTPVERVMSHQAVACHLDTDLQQVIDLLVDREISGIPVVDDANHVVGVVSERDVARLLGQPPTRVALHAHQSSGPFLREGLDGAVHKKAKDLMTSPPVTVSPWTPVRAAAEILLKVGINRLPVVDHGRLVGIVSRGDLLGALVTPPRSQATSTEPPIVIHAADAWLG